MSKIVFVLNSPPHSGKDTIADLMVERIGAAKHEFKEPLIKAAAKYYDVDLEFFKYVVTSREYKDTLDSWFSRSEHSKGKGMTPRQGLIHVSEEVFKPNYGADYFGKISADKISTGVNVFSDGGGWWPEVTPVALVADKIILCRLYRQGYTFDGDSRQYYNMDKIPDSIEEKVSICDIHLEEGNPTAVLDFMGRFIL